MSYIPTQATITIGGRVFTDLKNLITLYSKNPGNNSTYRRMGDQSDAGYQVPGGKTLKVYAIKVVALAGAGYDIVVAQSDNDVGLSGATALTNPKYFGTEGSTLEELVTTPAAVGAPVELSANPLGIVTTGKYATCVAQAGTGFSFLYGYLE